MADELAGASPSTGNGNENGNGPTTDWTAPYVSMTTFENFLDKLGSTALPARVDKGYLGYLNGSTKAALASALRSLGLIDDEGQISERLEALSRGGEERTAVLAQLAEEFYPEAMKLARSAGTATQLEQTFRDMGSSGATINKQVRFLLHLMDKAGIEKSPHFKAPRASTAPRKRRPTKGRANGGPDQRPPPAEDLPRPTEGSSRTVKLADGSTLTLALSRDVLKLPRADRSFVLSLIDQIDEYAEGGGGDEEGVGA